MNEHDYIEQPLVDRWWGEVEQSIHPLQDEAREHLFSGRFSEAIALETKVVQLTQHLMNVRAAAEDRLRWLELDAAFRHGGKNYPDFYEEVCSGSDWSKSDESQF